MKNSYDEIDGKNDELGIDDPGYTILKNKREVTKFQILVEIAAHQPAVRQQEVAAIMGVTPQAISEYIRELIEDDQLKAPGRGRYEVTRKGIEWILHNSELLESFAKHVRKDIIHQVSVWATVADEDLKAGDYVGVYMQNGLLRSSRQHQSANGFIIADTPKGDDAGVGRLEGIIEHHESVVKVCKIPRIERGGSNKTNLTELKEVTDSVSVVACVGIESWVSLRKIDRVPDLFYGSCEGVIEAALHGLSCAIVIVDEFFTDFLKQMDQSDVSYEIYDLVTK